MIESHSIIKLLEKWQGVLDKVVGAGLKIDEQHQIMLLLATLPNTLRAFVTAQGSIPNLTLPNMVANVVQEDSMMGPSHNNSKASINYTNNKFNGKACLQRHPSNYPSNQSKINSRL